MTATENLPWEDEQQRQPAGAYQRTRRDLEAAIGIDPIEVLQADRRAVIEELAPLRAKYGPGGTWDAKRKAFRSAVANEIALAMERGRPAVTREEEQGVVEWQEVVPLDTAALPEIAWVFDNGEVVECTESPKRRTWLVLVGSVRYALSATVSKGFASTPAITGLWERIATRRIVTVEVEPAVPPRRPSEAELERLAAADPRVLRWLDEAEQEMARYHLLDDEASSYTELINRDQALARYAANEPRT